jgi:hypothetical protein
MLDDPYVDRVWVVLVVSLAGSILCFYRYKLAWLIIPIVSIVAGIFLVHFLEPDNYGRIVVFSNSMPWLLAITIGSFILPVVATYLSWRRISKRRVTLA